MANIKDEFDLKEPSKQVSAGASRKILVRDNNKKNIKSWYWKKQLNKYENRLSNYLGDKKEIQEKMSTASSELMAAAYEKRLKSLEEKITIVNNQIKRADKEYNKIAVQVTRPRLIKIAAGPVAKITAFWSWATKQIDKLKFWNNAVDDYAESEGLNKYEEENTVDLETANKENSENVKNQIEQGFSDIKNSNNEQKTSESEDYSNTIQNDEKQLPTVSPGVLVENSVIPRPRERGVYETDEHYVDSLREFYKNQFPDIDIEPVKSQKLNGNELSNVENTTNIEETTDQIIDRVVGINDVEIKNEPNQVISFADDFKNELNENNINSYSSIDVNTTTSIKSESDVLKRMKTQLQELDALIAGKEKNVANKQAQLAEQEQSIKVEEEKNAELFARVNELLKSKESRINSLSAEEEKARERRATLDERQAAIMEEQVALEMMLNEGSNVMSNDNQRTI